MLFMFIQLYWTLHTAIRYILTAHGSLLEILVRPATVPDVTIAWLEWCGKHEWGQKVDSLMDSEMGKCRLELLVTLCQRSQVVIIEVACASEPHIR